MPSSREMRAVAGAMSRLASRVMRCQVAVVMYLERYAGYVTSGVYVHTRVHIPNILKDNRNRFKGVTGGEESAIQIDRKTL